MTTAISTTEAEAIAARFAGRTRRDSDGGPIYHDFRDQLAHAFERARAALATSAAGYPDARLAYVEAWWSLAAALKQTAGNTHGGYRLDVNRPAIITPSGESCLL